jgi:chaperonin GroEL
MTKMIAFEQQALTAIQSGVEKLVKTVRGTLGPCGHTVLLARPFGPPIVTKDGASVANAIELPDSFENIGAQMVRDVASKTNEVAGDGTTTATVLAAAIFNEGQRAVAAGINPVSLKNGIEKAVKDVVQQLKANSIKIENRKSMAQVATIAANNDSKIGECIADAVEQVGKQGVVSIEVGQLIDTNTDWVEGMQFDSGYISPYFANDVNTMECCLENPLILVYETKLNNLKQLLPLLGKVSEAGKSFLIIAEDVDGEALSTLVINRLQGTFNSCAVKSPGFGDLRREMLQDIAVLTGATMISENLGHDLEKLDLKKLGSAKKVIINKDGTTIIKGAGKPADIKARVAQIERESAKTSAAMDRQKLQTRIAKLSGGVAEITVGGSTESEAKEKTMRFEDALNATRASVEEGILPGGGVALIRAAQACKATSQDDDERTGYNIVLTACQSPLNWIATNAGKNGRLVCAKVAQEKGNVGYNAPHDRFEDLVQAGVIDPTKVVRCALENAASIATLLLTSGALIADLQRSVPNGKAQYDSVH